MSNFRQADDAGIRVRSFGLTVDSGQLAPPHQLVPPAAGMWHQLVCATRGAMTVRTDECAWVVPPHRAVWVPAGTECAILGGLSLGGYMSLAFYLAHPERVRALLLFDTGPGFRNDEARAAWNKRALETARTLEIKGLAALQSKSQEMAMSKHRSAGGLARAARGMLAQCDARVIKSLPNIRVPVLIIVGAEDKAFLA